MHCDYQKWVHEVKFQKTFIFWKHVIQNCHKCVPAEPCCDRYGHIGVGPSKWTVPVLAPVSLGIWPHGLWFQDCCPWGHHLCIHPNYCFILSGKAGIINFIAEDINCSIFRYLAICRPFSPRARSSPRKAKTIIVRIWIISFLSACPWARYTKVNYLIYDGVELEESSWCSIPFNEENIGSLYLMLASTLVYFLVPMITVSVLYIRLFIN